MSNTFTKFIDSCVGAIARKVQDEFDESKHPRDKGGRFSSKGGEGRGEGGLHHAGEDVEKYGEDPYTYIELSGDNEKVKNFIVEEGFDGDKEEAREYVPEAFEGSKDDEGSDEESDNDPVAKMRKHLDDDLFELATRSESEEEFISKAERRIKQDLWAAKSAPEELPVKRQKAEYALKKILSEIKSGTSEYW